jgi:hypothetical protein
MNEQDAGCWMLVIARHLAHFVGSLTLTATDLGLTPQALCCRRLRRLKPSLLKHALLEIDDHNIPGYPIRLARALEKPRVYHHRGAFAGVRDRRKHGHLQFD